MQSTLVGITAKGFHGAGQSYFSTVSGLEEAQNANSGPAEVEHHSFGSTLLICDLNAQNSGLVVI